MFKVSGNGRYAAWMEGMDPDNTTSMVFMDLESAAQQKIEAESGTKLRLFGFINNDMIYGVAKDEDIVVNAEGCTEFAMQEIRIQNKKGELVKSYSQDGYYVMDVIVQENLLELPRARKSSEGYVRTNSDQIMNNVKDKQDKTFSVITTTIERQANVTAIQYASSGSGQEPLTMEAKVLETMDDHVLDMQVKEDGKEEYYVYAKGKLWGIFEDAAAAVTCAEEQTGVVLNENQQYVWEKGSLKDKVYINPEEIPEQVRAGELNVGKLKESLKSRGTVVNLTGCTLEEILYELSASRPVITKGEDGKPKVIVGYDAYNTRLYDPVTQETVYCGMQDSTKLFESNGNVFICFIENIEQ